MHNGIYQLPSDEYLGHFRRLAAVADFSFPRTAQRTFIVAHLTNAVTFYSTKLASVNEDFAPNLAFSMMKKRLSRSLHWK
jgi:hypothetical protein